MTDRDAALRALVEKWRGEGDRVDSFHATMGVGYHACADELDQLLGSPVPTQEEQGNVGRTPAWRENAFAGRPPAGEPT